MSSIRIDRKLPRTVERGKLTTLTLPLRDESDAVQTLTSATLTITVGSKVLVNGATVSTLGPPASYSLAASVTENESLTSEYLEVWETDLGTFQVSGYLVRRAYHSHVTEGDLTSRYPGILKDLPPEDLKAGHGTKRYRTLAYERTQRRLLAKGRRPWLIFDPWALVDAEANLALHYWAAEAAIRFQDAPTYLRLKKQFGDQYEKLWGEVTFREDTGETGTIDNGQIGKPAAAPGVYVGATRPRSMRYVTWRSR